MPVESYPGAVHAGRFPQRKDRGGLSRRELCRKKTGPDSAHGRKPARIRGADVVYQRHEQRRGIGVFRTFVLHKGAPARAPEVVENFVVDGIADVLPVVITAPE